MSMKRFLFAWVCFAIFYSCNTQLKTSLPDEIGLTCIGNSYFPLVDNTIELKVPNGDFEKNVNGWPVDGWSIPNGVNMAKTVAALSDLNQRIPKPAEIAEAMNITLGEYDYIFSRIKDEQISSPWSSSRPAVEKIQLISDGSAPEGKSYLHITGSRSSLLRSPDFDLQPNNPHFISFWVRSNAEAGGGPWFWYDVGLEEINVSYNGLPDTRGNWKRVGLYFRPPAHVTKAHWTLHFDKPDTCFVDLDDIQLRTAPEEELLPYKTSFTGNPGELKNTRLGSAQEIYDLILSDLTMAKTLMPMNYNQEGRANYYSICAELARVYFLIGKHAEARLECDEILNSGRYLLQSDVMEAWNKAPGEPPASEVIMEYVPDPVTGQNDWECTTISKTMPWGIKNGGRGEDWNQCGWVMFYMTNYFMKETGWMVDPPNDYSVGPLAEVSLPKDLQPGEYELFVHNRSGGAAGWSTPLKLTIKPVEKSAKQIYNAKDFRAKGDSHTDDSKALILAIAEAAKTGGTVLLEPGCFVISETLELPSGVSIRGSGNGATTIQVLEDNPMRNDFPEKADLEHYAHDWQALLKGNGYAPMLWLRNKSTVSDLTLEYGPGVGFGMLVARCTGVAEDIHIERLKVIANHQADGWLPSVPVFLAGNSYGLIISDNEFTGWGAIDAVANTHNQALSELYTWPGIQTVFIKKQE